MSVFQHTDYCLRSMWLPIWLKHHFSLSLQSKYKVISGHTIYELPICLHYHSLESFILLTSCSLE